MSVRKLIDMLVAGAISDTYTISSSIRKSDGQTLIDFQDELCLHELMLLIAQFVELISLLIKSKNQTLDHCYEEFCQHKMPDYAENTSKSYKIYYKKDISPKLGERSVAEITARDLQIFLDDLNCKESRKKTIYTLLNNLFARAEVLKLIDINPMKEVSLTFPVYTDPMPFAQEELRLLQQRISKSAAPIDECVNIFLDLSYQCKISRELVLNLTWDDLDFDHACILLSIPASRKRKVQSYTISLPESLMQSLLAWKKKNKHPYICACKACGRLDAIQLNRILKPHLDAMKIHFLHGLDSENFMSDQLCCIKARYTLSEKKAESRKAKEKAKKSEKSAKKAC